MVTEVTDYLHRSFVALFHEKEGQEIWECIHKPENIIRAQTAAYLGKAPLDALTPELLKLDIFSPDSNHDKQRVDRFKQLTGSLVKYLMCIQLGKYELNENKTKLKATVERPQIFTTASTYRLK